MSRTRAFFISEAGELIYPPPDTVYRLAGHDIAAFGLADWKAANAGWLADGKLDVEGGVVREDAVHLLIEAAALSMRIAPWVTVYAAPGWTGDAQAYPAYSDAQGAVGDRVSYGGLAVKKRHVTLISIGNRSGWDILGIALHEAWHQAYNYMNDRAVAVADRAMAQGIPLHGDYYDDLEERSARAFSAYGLQRLSGIPAAPPGAGELTALELFEEIYSGAFGRMVLSGMMTMNIPEHIKESRWSPRRLMQSLAR